MTIRLVLRRVGIEEGALLERSERDLGWAVHHIEALLDLVDTMSMQRQLGAFDSEERDTVFVGYDKVIRECS